MLHFISERLAEREREEFEREMKEGYLANYDFIKESSGEWDFTLGDGYCLEEQLSIELN